MATIRDVAKESGFSVATVSIVLNDAPPARHIRSTTKTNIKRVAKKLDYHPNVFARSLRNRRSQTVGLLVFDITDPYCDYALRGIETSLYKSSFVPILIDVQSDQRRLEHYLAVLQERQVEGLIAIANSLLGNLDLLAALENSHMPTVLVGHEIGSRVMSAVTVDNQLGARVAFEHLYKFGHRRVAFIRGPKTLADSNERWKGICAFAHDAGLDVHPKLTMDLEGVRSTSSVEGGYAKAQELLRRDRSFTAIIAFDDLTAFGVIRALSEAGLRVPDDCSVVGFDDVIPAALYNPPLTTVRQPMEMMGIVGVDILFDTITTSQKNRPFKQIHRQVTPELVVRESTKTIDLS